MIEFATLRQLEQELGDVEHVRVVVRLFLERAHERMQAISYAVAAADATATERSAHALHGPAAMIGAVEVARTACALEELARGGNADVPSDAPAPALDLAGAGHLVRELAAHLDASCEALADWIGDVSALPGDARSAEHPGAG